MSVNVLRLIPTHPDYVPDAPAIEEAQRLFASLVPEADDVRVTITSEIAFIDQGSNFERVVCPVCGSELGVRWWQEVMDTAHAAKFVNLVVTVPCCQNECSLNDLRYEWPAGFARFVLEARSPNADLTGAQMHTLEQILGCTLKKIWAHY